MELQRFDLYRVNPPLVRVAAGVTALPFRPETNWKRYDLNPLRRSEGLVAIDFVKINGDQNRLIMAGARVAGLLVSLGGGLLCYYWSRQLYGDCAGMLALSLWCFSPTVLGHASVINPDAHAAVAAMAAGFTFWHWLLKPDWRTACLAGMVLGVAQLCKFTLLVFYPTWVALWVVVRWRECLHTGWRRSLLEAGQMATVIGISVCVINIGYLFEGTFQRLGEYRFQSRFLAGLAPGEPVPPEGKNRFTGGISRWPVPLPRNYLQGIDTQRYDFERGLPSYLRGQWADHGWSYYYLYALGVKMPLGTWCLVALAIVMAIFGPSANTSWRSEIAVLAPGLVILCLVSSQTGFSVHSRYVIPALPFFFVWASKLGHAFEVRPFARKQRIRATIVLAALLWSMASSLWTYPHSLSYFNELVGGPRGGAEHLLDSNIDWGQDLWYLRDWLDEHREVKLDGLAYSGVFPTTMAGIPNLPFPESRPGASVLDLNTPRRQFNPRPGIYALSVNYLHDPRYRYFLDFEPVATVSYCFYVYRITCEDAK